MTLTVFMTVDQCNNYRINGKFSDKLFDGKIYAHYLRYSLSSDRWLWEGWDDLKTISRKNLPQLTYDQFLALPTPITIAQLKEQYPEFYI